jgi:hypothetical protein
MTFSRLSISYHRVALYLVLAFVRNNKGLRQTLLLQTMLLEMFVPTTNSIMENAYEACKHINVTLQ